MNVGVGLFATLKSTQSSNFYAGARVWYGTGETEDETSGLDADIESFGLAPTIGFSYLPTKNISIGAEAFFSYSMMETDGDLGAVDFTRETDGFNTGTRLFLRYFCF